MQLVAYGAQDIYLTGNPSITFFKIVYRRHTNFAQESIAQTMSGAVNYGKKVSVTLSRNGDLISGLCLEAKLKRDTSNGTAFFAGEALLKEIDCEIGGQRVDRVYSDYARIYDELFRSADEKAAYKRMVTFDDDAEDGEIKRMFIPITLWFTRSPGLAVPLISLQYHELKLSLTFAAASEIPGIDVTYDGIQDATLWADYIFLDVDERRRFATVSHEYLITQCQHSGVETVSPKDTSKAVHNVRLSLNHPVRWLAWVIKGSKHGQFTGTQPGETNEKFAPLYSARLQLNGHDRFAERVGAYFNYVQPFQAIKAKPAAGVYLYSFALRPDEHQPSGSANFSRIDNATLILQFKQTNKAGVADVLDEDSTLANVGGNLTNLLVFAESYNILRIMSGINRRSQTVGCRTSFGSARAGKQWKLQRVVATAVAAAA